MKIPRDINGHELTEGSGCFSLSSTLHPDERSEEGSQEVLQSFGLQDEPLEQKNPPRTQLTKLFKKYDYSITCQTESHIRLTTNLKGEHHITTPNHDALKIGTFNNILIDIVNYLEIDKQSLIKEFLG